MSRLDESSEWVRMKAVSAGQEARLYGRRGAARRRLYELHIFPGKKRSRSTDAMPRLEPPPMRGLELIRGTVEAQLLKNL